MVNILFLALEQDMDLDGIISQNEVSEWLGIGYLNAYLLNHGISSEISDAYDIKDIVRKRPYAIGFSVLATNYEASKRASEQLRKKLPNTKII